MEVTKRDLSGVKVQESTKQGSKSKTVYPFRDSEGTSPKDILLVYDSNYYDCGLAWTIDALERVTGKVGIWTESVLERGIWKYYKENQVARADGTKRVDLPLWISASAIVSACVHERDFGNAWYGIAWALYHANEMQARKLLSCFESCLPKEARLVKKAKV